MDWDLILGPNGVAVGAVLGLVYLVREHLLRDKADRAASAEWQRLYLASLDKFADLVREDERDLKKRT